MRKFRFLILAGLAAVVTAPGFAQSPGQRQGPGRAVAPVQTAPTAAFRATNYEIRASLDTAGHVLTAKAKVDFAASDASRTVDVELNQNLRVQQVRDASGKPVPYDRDENSPLKLEVTLPNMVPAGGKVTLQFEYEGPLASRVTAPTDTVRLAYIDKDGGYLLLPARWFPLTDFPTNRFTGVFQIEVPGTMVVVGTGTSSGAPTSVTPRVSAPPVIGNSRSAAPLSTSTAPPPPSMENERMLYTFVVEKPEAAGTFTFSPLQLNPVRVEGVTFPVYTTPANANTAQSYADTVGHIVDTFNGEFGPLLAPGLKIAQMPDGSLDGYSAPGLLLVSAHEWTAQPNTRLLANLAAQQWWGNQVAPASMSDVWVTAGLARYSEGLFVEETAGKEALNKALEDFAVGALMFDNSAPIAEAGRLDFESEEYRSVVVNKGAMVYHMLRALIGDANFSALLKDFYSRYNGKAARITDFEKLAEAHTSHEAAPATFSIGNAPPAAASSGSVNLRPFFTQWLRSTGVPEFTLEYVTYRTKKGFRIVGKAKQNLDFFRMDVELEVQTEGNPEFKTIMIAGKESAFTVETFGRPKPNGIILDPHNFILKSSQHLRVRGIIARGETLAAQGRYYDAVQQYQRALELESSNALADFRMGEAFFYERNYAAAAQSFRDTLNGATDSTTRWTEVWSHIYLGRIYDIQGDRTRAVNEYSKAKQTSDDTGGAQAEAEKSLKKAYSETAS
jgi:hypothetical protein